MTVFIVAGLTRLWLC